MLKIVDTDLVEALEALAARRPSLDRRDLALDLHRLKKGDSHHYLFLARREKTFLFPLSEVFQEGSYANLSFLSPLGQVHRRPDVLLLQPKQAPKTRPRGNLTVLNYPDVAMDVEVFSLLTCRLDKETHLRAFLRSCRREAKPGKWSDYLRHLSIEGVEPYGHGR
ncbi:hypothetical protein [Intestinimonas butyriciproducens]|uniref:hypothetical protein n=1 Tax=Intestinimonas butyriciproducens TaxID=1297617 RepID=UPI00243005CE|nr:hypothetical protein [Intestinimonas butyriciproducens]MCI6362893.1 hypothetical protein [Intestinimonas butyriciproducens]